MALASWLLLSLLATLSCVQSQPRYLGQVTVPNAGLMNIFAHATSNPVLQRFSVLISSYTTDRTTYAPAYILHYPGQYITSNFTGLAPKNLYNFHYWGKEIKQVPNSVFGNEAIINFDGAPAITGKGAGSVYLTDMKDFSFPATYDLATTLIPETYAYASGLWKRVNGDNRDDVLTCRVQLAGGAARYAQLVWLDQPRDGMSNRWSINVLKDTACDTNLAETRLQIGTANHDVVYATGMYTKRLTFFYANSNNWENPSNVIANILEDNGSQYYDVVTADLNNDGKVDVLVTVVAETGGSVVVFEIPDDFRQAGQYIKRVIASGFNARHDGVTGRAPGIARTFRASTSSQQKPWILLSGGDDGRAYYLRPTSESALDWSYELITIVDHGLSQAVSGIAAADVDGDGYSEVFVSVHNKNLVEIYTFRP